MNMREMIVMLLLALGWGSHFVVIKLAVNEIPPVFYAAIRMTLVAVIMAAFLRWRPGAMLRVLMAGACLGALNYAFMFSGIKYATASSAAIALELYVPFATILSVIFLKDVVGWRRGVGIALSFVGVAVIALARGEGDDPEIRLGIGMGLVSAGAFMEAVGAVLVKKSERFKPHELMAWFSLVGACCLWVLTFLFEDGQGAALAGADKPLVAGAVIYSALVASIFGHTAYYWLIQRLPMTIVAPSTLLVTLFAVFFGVVLLGDELTTPMLIGSALTLLGVGIVVFRSASKEAATTPIENPAGGTP